MSRSPAGRAPTRGPPDLPPQPLDDLVIPFVGHDEAVPFGGDPHVGLRLGPRADQVGRAHHAHDRNVFLRVPVPRDLGAVQEAALVLHVPEAPCLDVLAEFRVRPRIGHRDLGQVRRGQRHPSAEDPLVALDQEVPAAADALGRKLGQHFSHVGLDRCGAGGYGDRDPVMAVNHKVHVADAVHLDRRDRLAAPLGEREPLPPFPHPPAGGPEPAVEVTAGVDGADDRVQPDGPQAEPPLAAHPQGGDDLVERQDEADVVRPAAQPLGKPGQHLAAAGALEVVLDVGAREAGVSGHRDGLGLARRGTTRPGRRLE